MKFEQLGSIDLINGAWYLVKGKTLSSSGYIIAQVIRKIKCTDDGIKNYIVVFESGGQLINKTCIEGLIRLK